MKLDGRVAVITGAGRGIGQAIALAYAREGARLALAARSESELEQAVVAVSELGAEAIAVPTDVTSQADTERLSQATVERFGRIDVLVNNAGISGPIGPLQDNDIAEWVDTINVNLTGTFLVCRAVIPFMLEQGGGRIINLSGAGVANAWSNMSAYCSSPSRGGVLSFEGRSGAPDRGAGAGTRGSRHLRQCPWPWVGAHHYVGENDGAGGGGRSGLHPRARSEGAVWWWSVNRRLRGIGRLAGVGRERNADGENNFSSGRRFSQPVAKD